MKALTKEQKTALMLRARNLSAIRKVKEQQAKTKK